jgi:hypothetical protein
MQTSAENPPFDSCLQFIQVSRGRQTCAEVP